MRGWRFGIVLLVGFAAFFGGASTRGPDVALAQDISDSNVLRSWDGSGVLVAQPSAPVPDARVALQRLGGSRVLMKVDISVLRRDMLACHGRDLRQCRTR
jgi:hypothetical protein